MKRDLVQVTAMIAMAIFSVSLVAGPVLTRHTSPAPAIPAPAVTTATLPACDDDAPGDPVTGPCWLLDDGPGGRLVRVFPYPYAPQPLYVLAGSGK